MKNKVLVELAVPELDAVYDVFIPINRKVGNVIQLLMQAVSELSSGNYQGNEHVFLYNAFTNEKYSINSLIIDTDIRNGSRLILS